MTSQPVYSTALQQALCLLPHISPTEMKVLISAAKAQWAPRFSNEILADSFRFISRKTLTEKICPVNSRYFRICVNGVPNVHKISKIGIASSNEDEPNHYLAIAYSYCYDTEKDRFRDGERYVKLDDFPHSAPFLRFDIVSIRTHFSASKICEFFRSNRESFSHTGLLKMEQSCFESNYILEESDVQLCGLLADVFKNCKKVLFSVHNSYGRQSISLGIFQNDAKLSADDKSLRDKWIGNMIAYITHYLFNTPNAFLKVDIPQESFSRRLVKKVFEVFKDMTMETKFCVSFFHRPDEIRLSDDETIVIKNDATQQRLLLFKRSDLDERPGWINRDGPPLEEFRLWCAKIKPNEDLSCVDGTETYEIEECESLYPEFYDPWDCYY
ncbi:hypothetical protein DdX_13282 [Ditylenchus destructor]|uniref:Uncharacterized protein n=1 Tax=Ditylenchus destructor TaxID=166010 RepID=A0AAD4R308_9BILA|nr:hypothetical protein DdX_13282 [Ditylenchus destructor]